MMALVLLHDHVLTCPHCGHRSGCDVEGEVQIALGAGDPSAGQAQSVWQLVACSECGKPILLLQENLGSESNTHDPEIVYPEVRRKLNPDIPAELRNDWEEAYSCLLARAYKAAVVMVRRVLEGACQQQGMTQKTLAASLRELSAAGTIDGRLQEWADLLRAVGNDGAHFAGRLVAKEDAEDAVAFAEAFLDHLYVLNGRFLAFKDRRSRGEGASTFNTAT